MPTNRTPIERPRQRHVITAAVIELFAELERTPRRQRGSKAFKDREHQLNVFHYILRHAEEGAWVWDFRTANPQPPTESPGTAVPGLSAPAPPAPEEPR